MKTVERFGHIVWTCFGRIGNDNILRDGTRRANFAGVYIYIYTRKHGAIFLIAKCRNRTQNLPYRNVTRPR